MTSPKSIWTDDSLETPFAAALKFRAKYWKNQNKSQTEIIPTFYSWTLLFSCTSTLLGSIMFFPPKSSEESKCLQFLLRYGKTGIENVQQVGYQCCGFTTQEKKLAALFAAKTGPNVGGNM